MLIVVIARWMRGSRNFGPATGTTRPRTVIDRVPGAATLRRLASTVTAIAPPSRSRVCGIIYDASCLPASETDVRSVRPVEPIPWIVYDQLRGRSPPSRNTGGDQQWVYSTVGLRSSPERRAG